MSIARHTFYNLVGGLVPLVTALVTVPLYLHQIGNARYGVLTIVWLILGYFGLFDVGLSRATANHIARLSSDTDMKREEVFWTALMMNGCFGVIGALLLYLVAVPLLGLFLHGTQGIRNEVLSTVPYIVVAVPALTMTSVLVGTLEGRSHFGVLNAIQAAGACLFQVVPLIAVYLIGPSLQVLIPVAVGVRVLFLIPLFIAAMRALPLNHLPRFRKDCASSLFKYGAWIMVTNIVGPILTSVDRFVIGATAGVSAVTYYTVPFNLVSRAGMLPLALSRAVFPRLSAANSQYSSSLLVDSITTLNLVLTPLIIFGIFLMHPFLAFWIGPEFTRYSAPIGEMLLLGIWINSLAFIPVASLQARGRPDLVAKFHAIELVPYAALLWIGVHWWGAMGAAVVWVVRVGADATLMFRASGVDRFSVRYIWASMILIILAWVIVSVAQVSNTFMIATGLLMFIGTSVFSLYCSPSLRIALLSFSRKLISKTSPTHD